jgi:hypothetical protein
MALYENINGSAVLVYSTPQILSFPLNGNKHFVDVPDIAQAALSFFKLTRIGRSKLLTPLTNGFIRDGDTTFRESFFNFAEAKAEPMGEPDGVADNFRRKTVTLVAGRWLFHWPSLPNPS